MPAMALDADRDELFAEYSWADDLSPEELDAILESEWVKAHWRRTKHGMVRVGAHARDQARRAVDDADAFHALTGRRTLVHRAAGPLSAAYSRVKNNPKVDLRANPVARARVAALRLADKAANFAADAATMRANLHPSDANQRSANTLQALRALASSLDRMDMKMQSARRAANEQRAATGRPKAQQTPRAPQLTQRQKLEKELRSREAHVDVRMDALDNALRSNDPSRIMAAQRDLADAQRAVRSLKSRLGRLTEAFAEACLSWIEEEEEAMLESLAELDWVSDATLEELEDLVEAVTSGKRWGSVYGSRRRKKPTTGFSSYSAGRGRNARGEITVSRNLKTGAYRKYNVSGRKPKLIGRGGASVSRKKAWSKVGAGTANRLYARGTNLTKNSRRGQSYQLVKVRGRRAHVYGTGASRKVIVLKRK
jgi:hypothetical protein